MFRVDPSHSQRLGALFDQAVGLDAAGQAELLRTIEREDAELAQALRSLLEADARHSGDATGHSDRVLQHVLAVLDAPGGATGDRVGAYLLCEELGRGGMGVVFRAERADGQVRQEVAIKIVRSALLDASGRERFLRERKIVASFQHPFIARMLDVGETADGSPYLAMELIRGLPITGWCDVRSLGTRRRVEAFLCVCEAVQHAHANLVLHRDLKPGNVLVGDDGLPKLIDFGIAKPLGIVVDDEHQQTATAQRFFSPSNVAPEQLRGERVGVACDVYQLGTLLHELLCGATVFDAKGLTPGQLEQKILDVAPEAPSARASRVSDATAQAHGAASAAALARELRGDLDAIVAHALRKSPPDRYRSVEQLAEDLRRFLGGLPVAARRGQRWYRARKFLRRNVLAVGISTAVAALVALFVTALWLQSQRIARERNLAQQRANEVEQVARFEADMLKQVDPIAAGKLLTDDMHAKFAAALIKAGVPESERAAQVATFAELLQRVNATDTARDLADRTTLRPAIAAIDKQFKDQPVVAATLRQVLADRYVEMGLFDAAMPLQQSALASRRRVLGEQHPDTLTSINSMGKLLMSEYKWNQAESYFRDALGKRRGVLGRGHPDTVESMRDLGEVLMLQEESSEAEPYLRQALELSRRVNGDEDRQTLYLLNDVGTLLEDEGKLSEAERYFREALGKSRRVLGEDSPETLQSIGNLGWVLWHQGKQGEAEKDLRESLEKSRRVLGEEHPDTVNKINILGLFLTDQGRHSEAELYFREVAAVSPGIWGKQNWFTVSTMGSLGTSLEQQGKLSEAEANSRQELEYLRRTLGDKASETLYVMDDLGRLLVEQGKLSEAEPLLREALETSRRALGDKDLNTLLAISFMGNLLVAQGKYNEAEQLLAPGEAASSDAGNPYVRALILLNLGKARTRLGEFAAAETELLEANHAVVTTGSPHSRYTPKYFQAVIDLYSAWNIAEPGKGYGAKADAWRRELAALDPGPSAAH